MDCYVGTFLTEYASFGHLTYGSPSAPISLVPCEQQQALEHMDNQARTLRVMYRVR